MPKIVDAEQKRREILKAAVATFSRHGYRDTNLQRVAARAGIGKSSIYHYFPTRDALFDALIQHLLQEEASLFAASVAADGSAAQRFETLLLAVTELIDDWVKAGPLLLDCLRDARGRKAVGRTLQQVRDALARLIADGQRTGEFRKGDPGALAAVVVGCLDGLLLQRLLEPTTAVRGKGVDAELRTLLREGLRARGER